MARDCRWTNRLVGFLRGLAGLISIGRLRQEFLAEVFADHLPHFRQRVVRHLRRVGTHVGDQADGSLFAAEIDAFIQTLGDHHRPLDAEAQLARGVLLELAGGEGRGRTAPALARFNRTNRPVGLLQRGFYLLGFLAVGNRRLLVANADKTGVEGRRLLPLQMRVDGPVLFLIKCLDLALALDDEAQGDGLHAPGREAATNFVP